MLNGKAEGSSALERARAWRKEGPALKRALADEREVLSKEVDERQRRIAEIDQEMSLLPSDGPDLIAQSGNSVTLMEVKTPADGLSGTDAIRLVLLQTGDGQRAEQLVAAARQLDATLTARNLYNSLHRLYTRDELCGEGERGSRRYSFTPKGRTHATEIAHQFVGSPVQETLM